MGKAGGDVLAGRAAPGLPRVAGARFPAPRPPVLRPRAAAALAKVPGERRPRGNESSTAAEQGCEGVTKRVMTRRRAE
jgi:hypothetical protein